MEDPIVEEVRRIRDEHAARFNYDLNAIFRDLKEQQRTSGRIYVSLPPRKSEAQIGAATTTAPIAPPLTDSRADAI